MSMELDLSAIDSPAALASLINDLSNDELNQVLQTIGAPKVLEQIFAAMEERLDPGRTPADVVVQWEIDASEGRQTWGLRVVDRKASATPGPAEDPRVTLQLAIADFLRLVSGSLNGMEAFMGGKIKITGDLMFAAGIQNWFRMS